MKNKGPYKMKPGSKEIDTPGSFRADSKAMFFKPMQTGQKKAPPSEQPKKTKSNKEMYFEAMKRQNDSLRALPQSDKHHVPTFDTSTKEGMEAKKKFYTFSPGNKKLGDIRKLGGKLRKKFGL
tara:strand:+ start:686 stop:1054 length:369 start_codon:yes stop_codon:yes gene_type:complete